MSLQAITDDIYQVQLPLPFALRSVNCYLIAGAAGWTIVDTGLNTSAAREVWQTVWHELKISPQDIHQIVLTHTHPDHYGLAGWLQQQAGHVPPVLISPREALLARQVWQEQPDEAAEVIGFWQQCGVPADLATAIVVETDRTRQRTKPHPQVIQTIEPGTTITLGDRLFQIIHTPGHSDGQVVFYDAAERLLLCGDHVLQRITPNISLWPFADADPLGRYLQSLHEVMGLDVVLALAGHGPLIYDLRGRIREIERHHEERLVVMETAVQDHATPYTISQQVFDFDRLTIHEKRFAVAETLAHLDYLVEQQRLQKLDQGNGWLYNRPY